MLVLKHMTHCLLRTSRETLMQFDNFGYHMSIDVETIKSMKIFWYRYLKLSWIERDYEFAQYGIVGLQLPIAC